MSESHRKGMLAWVELSTSSLDDAHAFYIALFGWSHKDNRLSSGQAFCILSCEGNEFGSMYETQEGPPGWMVYFRTEDLDETLESVERLQGRILTGPHTIGDAGRMAVCADPAHAVFSLWEPHTHPGMQKMGIPGLPAWIELATHDIEKVQEFYCDLFGWETRTTHFPGVGTYLMFTKDGRNVAGGIQFTESDTDLPPYWLIYFSVRSIEGTLMTARALGGRLILPSTDVEGVGKFALIQDPVGGLFACIEFHGS